MKIYLLITFEIALLHSKAGHIDAAGFHQLTARSQSSQLRKTSRYNWVVDRLVSKYNVNDYA
jgi:hypothetical protein